MGIGVRHPDGRAFTGLSVRLKSHAVDVANEVRTLVRCGWLKEQHTVIGLNKTHIYISSEKEKGER
jgi:hypothetical protein